MQNFFMNYGGKKNFFVDMIHRIIGEGRRWEKTEEVFGGMM